MNYYQPDNLPQGSFDFLLDFLAGGSSGVIARTCIVPLRRFRFMTRKPTRRINMRSQFQEVRKIVTEEGILHLWKGHTGNYFRYFFIQAFNFAFKDVYRAMLLPKKRDPCNFNKIILANILSGGLAGITTTSFLYPLSLTRIKMEFEISRNINERQFAGVWDCFVKTKRTEGIIGLYRGISISLVNSFIYRGLYFGTYDSGKRFIFDHEKSSLFQKFIFAQVCVILSESIAYPTEIIKRKLMTQIANKNSQYTGTIDCIKKTFTNEGLEGFWKGNFANLLRSVTGSLCLVLYDEIKYHTRKYAY